MTSRKSKVATLSLAQVVTTIVGVVSGMVFARTLTVADYATYLQTFIAYDFAVPLLTMGLPTALFFFLPGAKERQKGLVLDNMVLLFLSGLIFSLFLLFGGTELLAIRFNNPDLKVTLKWMVFYPLYTFPIVLSAILVINNKVKLNAVFDVITGILLASLLIITSLITKHYVFPVLVKIFFPLLIFPAIIYISFRNIPGEWYKPNINSMWKMLKFGVPLGLATVFGTLSLQLSNLMVSFLCSPTDFAIFANGAREVPIVGMITGSIATIIMADMAIKCKEGNKKEALELFRKASVLSALFLIPVMVFLLFYAESFINVLYTVKYVNSITPFRIYLFILPIRIVYYGSAFMALGKTKLVLYRSIGDLTVNAILCYFFVKWIGANGAALATICSLYFWTVPYNLFKLGKEFICNPTYIIPFNKIKNIFGICLISGLLSSFFIFFNISHLFKLILGGISFFSIYGIVSWKLIPEFKETMNPLANNIKQGFV